MLLAVFFKDFIGIYLPFVTPGLREFRLVKAQDLRGEIGGVVRTRLADGDAGERHTARHLHRRQQCVHAL